MKITNLIMGLLFTSFIVIVFALYIGEMKEKYSPSGTDDSTELQQTFEVYIVNNVNLSENIKEATNINQQTGITDIIGGYFSGGYTSLKMTANSFDTFFSMLNYVFTKNLGLGAAGGHLKNVIYASAIILIFVGVIIAAIVKRDL